MNQRRQARRVACIRFSADEVNALRSLLGLLDPYLRQDWEITDPDQADLVLARVDDVDDAGGIAGDKPLVGCARRPREHASPSIHRPLRASEILTVLNEFGEPDEDGDDAAMPEDTRADAPWRLTFWPLDYEAYPPAWHQALAALTARTMSTRELVACTGMQRVEADRCLAALRACGALVSTSTAASPRPDAPSEGWRQFISGIGRKLGLRT